MALPPHAIDRGNLLLHLLLFNSLPPGQIALHGSPERARSTSGARPRAPRPSKNPAARSLGLG